MSKNFLAFWPLATLSPVRGWGSGFIPGLAGKFIT